MNRYSLLEYKPEHCCMSTYWVFWSEVEKLWVENGRSKES